jgi:hypothetical protein
LGSGLAGWSLWIEDVEQLGSLRTGRMDGWLMKMEKEETDSWLAGPAELLGRQAGEDKERENT